MSDFTNLGNRGCVNRYNIISISRYQVFSKLIIQINQEFIKTCQSWRSYGIIGVEKSVKIPIQTIDKFKQGICSENIFIIGNRNWT